MRSDQLSEQGFGFSISSLVPKISRQTGASIQSLVICALFFLLFAQRLSDLSFCFFMLSLLIQNGAK